MNYYLINRTTARPLVRDEVGRWWWGHDFQDRSPFLDEHLHQPYRIMYAERASQTGCALRYERRKADFGLLDSDGGFYGCQSGAHRKILTSVSDYTGRSIEEIQKEGVFVYEQDLVHMSLGFDFYEQVECDGLRLNVAQNETLAKLGFDTSTYKRPEVPDYDDVFTEASPAYASEQEISARVIEDPQEVLAFMEAQSPKHPVGYEPSKPSFP